MQSAREFILETLSSHGPTHGYGILERSLSTPHGSNGQPSASAIYGALRRMERRGEVVVVRVERRGKLPPRTIYALGDSESDL